MVLVQSSITDIPRKCDDIVENKFHSLPSPIPINAAECFVLKVKLWLLGIGRGKCHLQWLVLHKQLPLFAVFVLFCLESCLTMSGDGGSIDASIVQPG